jgi:hypothetical protein
VWRVDEAILDFAYAFARSEQEQYFYEMHFTANAQLERGGSQSFKMLISS